MSGRLTCVHRYHWQRPTPAAVETSRTMSEPALSVYDPQVALDPRGRGRGTITGVNRGLFNGFARMAERLAESRRPGNTVDLRRAAHTIKGAVGYFGADEAGRRRRRLQELGRAGDAVAAVASVANWNKHWTD